LNLFEITEFKNCNDFHSYLANMLRYHRRNPLKDNEKADLIETLNDLDNSMQIIVYICTYPDLINPLQKLKSYLN